MMKTGKRMALAATQSHTELSQSATESSYRTPVRALLTGLLVAGCSFALLPLWQDAIRLWMSDPLRSIGAAFPAVAFLGVMAAWRRLGWTFDGSWWGLLLVAITLPLARMADLASGVLRFGGHDIGLVHPGIVFFLYGVGAVLLFGSRRLLRAAIAPLCLLLLVNPVPYLYNTFVDLPLQEISANTARAFAHLIGLHPTGEQLKMMFTPDFGMLIVPGCNGVRGSVTFAYLALFFGYSRRLRPRTLVAVTLGAFLLGFAMNLLRLCVLVIYYRIGISWTAIQEYGVGVDYAIGCTIFLLGTLSLGVLIRSLEPPAGSTKPTPAAEPATPLTAKLASFAALTLVFIIPQAHSLATAAPLRLDEATALKVLPATVGNYKLIRSYAEYHAPGAIAAAIGEYQTEPGPAGVPGRITLGLWVSGANHTVWLSRLTQGSHPTATNSTDATALHGLPVHFADTYYDTGMTHEEFIEAACSDTLCVSHTAGSGGAVSFSAPRLRDMVWVTNTRRLPIYLQREWPDLNGASPSALRAQFEADARLFTSQLDIPPLVSQVGTRP